MKKKEYLVKNEYTFLKALQKTKKEYRPLDPGWYLYRQVLSIKNIDNKFKKSYIELIYVTLAAWNMNSRGAKLSNFNKFYSSILKNKKAIISLSRYSLQDLSTNQLNNNVLPILEKLFYDLNLVGNSKNGNEKPRLVTFSKTLHFLLPKLVPPIDRKYTLNFFYGNVSINKKLSLQFKKFKEIFNEFHKFSKLIKDYKIEKDGYWNSTIPKIIDNFIIGYQKMILAK